LPQAARRLKVAALKVKKAAIASGFKGFTQQDFNRALSIR